jgi:hypothetical protein
MNNTTTKRTLTIVAILMAATLTVGSTFAATSAFAYKKGQDSNSKNANRNPSQEINSKTSANGIDATAESENENQICTRPNDNATCSEEGITSAPQISTPITPQPPTLTSVSGQGQNFCPGAAQSSPASITFSVQQNGGVAQGQFNVPVQSQNPFIKTGTLNGFQISGGSFAATGTELSQGPLGCGGTNFPSATISGQCGTGVTIQFATADGEHATFTGKVA